MTQTYIAPFDVHHIRGDFPILHQQVNGKPLVYLDNAASSQKPLTVIEAMNRYYREIHSNVHRGLHHLSQQATDAYEGAREKVREFINARHTREIIFTRSTTESVNLVAASFGRNRVKKGDEVLITAMEHHSNLVPWQLLCEEKGAHLKVIPISDDGELLTDAVDTLLNDKTKLLALSHVSNALGTVNPVKKIITKARAHNVPVLIDGAQAVAHIKVDVQDLGCDFYCFSGHKMLGPTGIGILYGMEKHLDKMPPYHGGGNMINTVTFEKTTYADLPHKFEAGTPAIAEAIGLGAAIDYISRIGRESIAHYEDGLLRYALSALEDIAEVRIIGKAKRRVGVISFLVGDIHHYDTGTILNQLGIAVRTGHHCNQPLMNRLGISGTTRASFAFYNTREEADALVEGLKKVQEMFWRK